MKEFKGIINLDFPEKPYSTYIMYSEDINDKSVYIGSSEGSLNRTYTHSRDRNKKKFQHYPLYIWINNVIDVQNKKVLFRVLEKEKYTRSEAHKREKELVIEYLKNGYNVLNVQYNKNRNTIAKGIKLSNERKKQMSDDRKQQYKNGRISSSKKKVYKYDNDYNVINIYPSIGEASKNEGYSREAIGKWCSGVRKSRNKYIWSYTEEINKIINNIELNLN